MSVTHQKSEKKLNIVTSPLEGSDEKGKGGVSSKEKKTPRVEKNNRKRKEKGRGPRF